MTFMDFIGFLIVLLALLLPVIRRTLQKKMEQKNPEEYARRKKEKEEREKAALRNLLTQMGEEIPPELREEREEPPPAPVEVTPPPAPPKVYQPLSNINERHLDLSIEEDKGRHLLGERFQSPRDAAYAIHKQGVPKVRQMVNRTDLKEMVLLREILEPPIALRE